jgi:TonB family protein
MRPSLCLAVAFTLLRAPAVAFAQIAPTTSSDGTPSPAPGEAVAPRLTQFVQAEYPPEALAQGIEGSVLLELSIDATGRVTEARVLRSVGYEALDRAALEAARRFVFEPARRDGVAVPAVLRYRYRFSVAAARAAQGPRVLAVLRGTLRGTSDRPVVGATVTATLGDAPAQTATTDAQGAFRFEFTTTGEVRIEASAEGYQPFALTETLREGDDLGATYRMTALMPTLAATEQSRPGATPSMTDDGSRDTAGEATVRARRPAREVTRRSLEFREILRMPGTGGDALRAVQNFPGVARSLNGLLLVRGTVAQDTQIFVDGTVIPIIYHFGGLSSVISSELLDRIDFYPGSFSGRFGRAQGGIVDVGIRSPRRQGWRGVANVNLIDASLFVEGAITRELSFAASIRRSYIDAVLGLVLNNIDAVSFTSLPVYWDYQAVLEWRPSSRDRVRFAVLGSDDSLSILLNGASEQNPRFTGNFSTGIGFHTAQVLWDHTFSSDLTSRAVASFGRNMINFGGGEAFGLDLAFWQYTFRYELSYQASRQARLNVGMDIVGGPGTVRFNGFRVPTEGQPFNPANTPRVSTDTESWSYRPAAYAEFELTPMRGLRLVPSVRVDYTRDANRSATVSPRTTFRWEMLDGWFVKGGVGLFTQPPQNQQTSDAPNVFMPNSTVGNPFLVPQRAIHYGLGFDHDFSQYINLSIEGFYRDLDAQVVSQPGITTVSYLNNGAGRIYGAEILLRHRPSERFFGWLAYTLSRSERRDAPGQDYRIFQFDQTHILTAIASVRLGRGWELGARFRFVTGNPTTPVAGAVFNADSGTYTQVPGRPFSTRVDPFHQLDLRVDKTWSLGRRGTINLYLEVLNVYNNANPEGVQYNYNFTQSAVVTGIPIFPNLGLRAEY